MTPSQEMWHAVLIRMADSYPSSGYAEALSLKPIARAWDADMPDVPAKAVLDLYAHLIFTWTISFPPSIGDFRKAWRDWDYWAEVNKVSEDVAPRAGLAALMPAPRDDDGPHLRAFRLQALVVARTGAFVCCDCLPMNGYGAGNTAVFSRDEKFWVCDAGRCNFRRPLETPEISPGVAAQREFAEKPIVTRARAEALAGEFEIETLGMGAADWLALFGFLAWLDRQSPARKIARETYAALWEEFAAAEVGA